MSELITNIREEDGKVHITRTQDIQRILDFNKERNIEGYDPRSEWRHATTIPFVLVEAWMKESGLKLGSKEFAQYIKKKILSGEYSKLKANGF